MEFTSSLKKSFKKHHSRKISSIVVGVGDNETNHEQLPILAHHTHPMGSSSVDLDDRREVIVKIDGLDHKTSKNNNNQSNGNGMHDGNNVSREMESSYKYCKDDNSKTPRNVLDFERGKHVVEDPPSKLIGQFLNRQKAAGAEMSLDVDLEMDELHTDNNNNNGDKNGNNRLLTSKELKVSFCQASAVDNVIDIVPDDQQCNKNEFSSDDEDDHDDDHKVNSRRGSSNMVNNLDSNVNNNTNNNNYDNGDDQVLRCTSFQRRRSVTFRRMKSKSRLIDPPEITESSSIRSGALNRASGMLGNKPNEEEEDDPLFDEDVPEEYRKQKLNALTLLQWISLFVIVAALICTLSISEWKRKSLRGLRLWKWEVLVLVLICGRLVSGWGIRIVVFFIERNFMLRKRVLYFVYGVRKAVQNCIWLGLVLIAWHYMFDKEVDGDNKFLQYVNNLMVCMLVGTLLWLVKTLIVKVLASSFHVSTFFDRIQESLYNQYVIETLSGPPLIEMQLHQEEEYRTVAEVRKLQNAGVSVPPDLKAYASPPPSSSSKSGRAIGNNPGGGGGGGGGQPKPPARGLSLKFSGPISKTQEDQGITIDHLHRLNPKNISAWNMKRLMKIVRHGTLSTLDEQILGSPQEDDESSRQIRNEYEAKVAARKIFRNVAKPGSKFIYMEDLLRFLREEEALKTMMNLAQGSSKSEKISKASLKNWVVNAFRERRALALTLNDTKTAVNKLHQMVNVLVGIIILLICLVILGIATSQFLLFLSSQIVVVAFIFGNTCKTIFEAIIFVFVMHPFDVGDRCEIDGVQMIVEEMNILTTVFLRYDNQKIIYPNTTLSTRPISNYYRSPDMTDTVDFAVHIATPAEKISITKERITSYIENKKEYWYPAPTIVLMDLADLNKLKMSVWVRHTMNHQDIIEKWRRRALLVEEMVKIFKELDIEYRLYPLDINLRSMPPLTSTRLPSTWTT